MKSFLIFCISCVLLPASCSEKTPEEELLQIGLTSCQIQPGFLSQTGLNPKSAALSTSEKKIRGLVLVEYDQAGTALSGKNWQHPSWDKFGWMGAIASDDRGNSYVAPAPVVSVLDNPVEKQNIIYKVDGKTAEMKPFLSLPGTDTAAHENPYGLLGLYFDCHAKLLYASSVAGSSRQKENGCIYAINTTTGEVVDKLEGVDAMGLLVGGVTGEKKLYAGSSRQPVIYSVQLSKAGLFMGKPSVEFSLDMIGPRGDDKARRIRFDKDGSLLVWGIGFSYNLTAASEKQETIYRFVYNKQEKKWIAAATN